MPAKPKELSRQRRYQLAHEAAGLCCLCTKKATPGNRLCKRHREIANERNRLNVRRRLGLPDNAPLLRGDRRTKTKTGDPVV
jgi:hypothetical protein